jgi:predicted alpha/beta superfamily hydrolase
VTTRGKPQPKRRIAAGRIQTLDRVRSPQRHNERPIYIYLPPSYDLGDRRYPVVYMQDGQNLFDESLSFAGEWGVDECIDRLSAEGIEAIVAGVPNIGPERFEEYSPFPDRKHGGGDGDSYLAFLIDTVKPLVDARFRTNPARSHTGILGSSMGGLISLYAFFARENSFGFAGAMSPSLWYGDRRIFDIIAAAPQRDGRIYLDVGTEEGAGTLNDARRMQALLADKGLQDPQSLKYVEDAGANHSEQAWSRRFDATLRFLLPAG